MQTPTFTNTLSSLPFPWLSRSRSERVASPETAAVADHKWFLSERLGRDVGYKVASLDYCLNVLPAQTAQAASVRKPIGPIENWFLNALERLGEAHGAATWARLPESARTQRSND